MAPACSFHTPGQTTLYSLASTHPSGHQPTHPPTDRPVQPATEFRIRSFKVGSRCMQRRLDRAAVLLAAVHQVHQPPPVCARSRKHAQLVLGPHSLQLCCPAGVQEGEAAGTCKLGVHEVRGQAQDRQAVVQQRQQLRLCVFVLGGGRAWCDVMLSVGCKLRVSAGKSMCHHMCDSAVCC